MNICFSAKNREHHFLNAEYKFNYLADRERDRRDRRYRSRSRERRRSRSREREFRRKR